MGIKIIIRWTACGGGGGNGWQWNSVPKIVVNTNERKKNLIEQTQKRCRAKLIAEKNANRNAEKKNRRRSREPRGAIYIAPSDRHCLNALENNEPTMWLWLCVCVSDMNKLIDVDDQTKCAVLSDSFFFRASFITSFLQPLPFRLTGRGTKPVTVINFGIFFLSLFHFKYWR